MGIIRNLQVDFKDQCTQVACESDHISIDLEEVHVAEVEGVEVFHRHGEALHNEQTFVEDQFELVHVEHFQVEFLVDCEDLSIVVGDGDYGCPVAVQVFADQVRFLSYCK